jgi:hypothetical protein
VPRKRPTRATSATDEHLPGAGLPAAPKVVLKQPRQPVDQRVWDLYLERLAETGFKIRSAVAAGTCYETVRTFLLRHPAFKAEEERALSQFREKLEAEAYRRAYEGVDEPIIGGKDRDEVVCHVKRYSDRLMEKLLEAHIPERFRQHARVDVSLKSAVVAIPAAISPDEWKRMAAAQQSPRGAIVDADYREVGALPAPAAPEKKQGAGG